jgi:hypothetical protein
MNAAKLSDNQRRQILSQQGLDDRAIGKALANPAIARAKTEEDLLTALGQSRDTKRQLPPTSEPNQEAKVADQNSQQHDETDQLEILAQQALLSRERRVGVLTDQAAQLEEEAIIAHSRRRGVRLALLAQQVKLDAYSSATLRLNQGFVSGFCDDIRQSNAALRDDKYRSQLTAEQEAQERLAPSRDALTQSLGE